jgi:hypothetical protein
VYREHVISEDAFARIQRAAKQQGLSLLSPGQSVASELGKSEARQIAEELDRLRRDSALPDLDGDVIAFADVARWCARATVDAWLSIERR